MKSCLVIINKQSGRACSIDENRIRGYLSPNYILTFNYFEQPVSYDGYSAVAVCGGDGTLSTVLQETRNKKINIYYFPFGTVNDRARTALKCCTKSVVLVNFGQRSFSYVAACGSFTAIGYKTDTRRKKRYKAWAYLSEALRQFKIHRIKASINMDSRLFEGTYTLIMLIKSKCCFYFPFNKLYDAKCPSAHMLLIKSPVSKGLFGLTALFILFFRVFFIGIRKHLDGKRITFLPFEKLTIDLEVPYAFCVDGERYIPDKRIDVAVVRAEPRLEIIPRRRLKKRMYNVAGK